MTERLQNNFQFVEVGRADPSKKSLHTRKTRYVEIYEQYQPAEVAGQAHRCLECGNP